MSSTANRVIRQCARQLGIPGGLGLVLLGLTLVWRHGLLPEKLEGIDYLYRELGKPPSVPMVIHKPETAAPVMDWSRFPDMSALSGVYRSLHGAASTSGFVLPEVAFKTQPLPFTPLNQMTMDLAFTTTYPQFKQWLAILMVAEPSLNVQQMSLHRSNVQQTALDIKLRLRWYAIRHDEEGIKVLTVVHQPVSKNSDHSINAIKERLHNDDRAIQQATEAM